MPIEAIKALRHIFEGTYEVPCPTTGKKRVIKKTLVGYSCSETDCERNGQAGGVPLYEEPTIVNGRVMRGSTWFCAKSRGEN